VAELPSGTVTFLFTDIEGSTRLWEEFPEGMQGALATHDAILRDSIEHHGGQVVKTTGDGFHAAFGVATDAAVAALAVQRALEAVRWTETRPLRVRVGIHTGAAELRDGDYYGTVLNRAARLMSIAHGGQVVCSQATADLLREPLPVGVELADLGEHALRDLARPERVYQISEAGVPQAFPPLRSIGAFPGNLPLQSTSFVGREREVEALATQLLEARLVTLTGVGGVGKTRLSLQVAAELLPRFADGTWFCELATAIDRESMGEVIAAVIGAVPLPGLSIEASVVEFLRSRELLLVLDNCEHLLVEAADLVDEVMRSAARVRILATSREGLGVLGEQLVAVRSLPLPKSSADAGAVGQSDAVRLFVDRAAAVRSGFELDAANSDAIVEICARLDGIPLAIELAAARVATMNPSDVARRIDERFRLLTGGRRVGIERHQTLRATVDWSYSLLTEQEQLVFDRLSVFVGSFDAAAAEAVVAGEGVDEWGVVDALGSLVLKSMVTLDDRADDDARYQLLETMRAYGRERLDERGETEHWRRRHAAHYAETAESLGDLVRGPDEIVWRRRLRSELDNLRAAVTWSLDCAALEDQRLAMRVIAALAYEVTMDRSSGYGEWAERALPHLAVASAAERFGILGAAAFAAIHRGDFATSGALLVQAIAEGLPEGALAPNLVYVAFGSQSQAMGHPEEAVAWMERGTADIVGPGGEFQYEAVNLDCVLAIYLVIAGDEARARQVADDALVRARKLGNPSQLSIACGMVGGTWRVLDPGRAGTILEEGISLTRAGASDVMLGPALAFLAYVRAVEGQQRAALELIRASLAHCIDCGDWPGLTGTLGIGVSALVVAERWELAMRLDETLGAIGSPWFHGNSEQEYAAIVRRYYDALGESDVDIVRAELAGRPRDEVARDLLRILDEVIAGTPGETEPLAR